MKSVLLRSLVLLALLVVPAMVGADNMIMGRAALRAEIVLEYVKSSIEEHGYRIAHIQLCDGGMKDFGYESDVYRVVFFGKLDEVRMISEQHPAFVSYLPLKIAVIAEKDETLLTALNPEALSPFYPDRKLQIQLGRWHNDLISIFQDIRRSTAGHAAATE